MRPSALAVLRDDDELDFRGLLYQQVGGLLALENPAGVASGTCRCLDCEDLFDHACVPDMLVLRNFERDTATAAKRGGTRLRKYRRPTIPMRSRAALESFTREHRAMKIFAYWSFGRNLAGGAG